MTNKIDTSYQKVPLIATGVSIILAIVKFIVWILTWSVLILSSALDSILDIAVSIFNYIALKISLSPADREYNYGKWKIEWIAAVIEWSIITLSGAFIIYESIDKLINKNTISDIDIWIYVIIFSIIVVFFLVLYLSHFAKKTNNLVIQSDLMHYKTDLITNWVIIISLTIIYFTKFYVIDFILWILAWIYIIKEALELSKKWIDVLLDKSLEERSEIEKILNNFVKNWVINSWHDFKTRKWWIFKFVEFHFVVDPNTTVKQAHEIINKIKQDIYKLDENYIWEIIWHADYEDDSKFKELKQV